ncbi:MAG TPA: hypothetical protein VIF43_04005 [Patescibacteria group bacterium]|jgi:hypothetical protein
MLSVLFLISAAAFGTCVACLLPIKFRIEERVFAGIPVGLAVGGLLGFVWALLFGMSAAAVAVPSALLSAGALAIGWRSGIPDQVASEAKDFRKRWRGRWFRLGALAFLALAALLSTIMWRALFEDGGSIYAGFGNVWGDWNQHLAQTTSFIHGDNFPPEQTALAGQKITYPLLTNFVSAMLAVGGIGLTAAMKVPGVLLIVCGLGLLMAFLRLTVGPKAMVAGAVLFYLFGGLGFVNLIVDFVDAHQSLGTFLAKIPNSYTSTGSGEPFSNINFINPIFAYLVPQRAFLFGLPLTLAILSLLYAGLKGRDPRKPFLAAGLLGALLPLVHTHSLVFLGLLTPGLVVFTWSRLAGRRKRRLAQLGPWLYFIVPILLLALPQVLWVSSGVRSYLFFRYQLGWTAHGEFLPWFWLKNAGLFLPLLLVSFWWLRKRNPLLLQFTGAGAIVWLVANLYVFQPWDWDNTKLLVYWLLMSIPAVAALLVWLFERGGWARAGVAVLFPFLILAGIGDVAKTVPPNHYRALMFDPVGGRIAETVRERSAPDSVWLTSQVINNPVGALAGRSLVLGYTGWLWSYGLDYKGRELDVTRIYEGDPETPALLKQYGTDYVMIGPSERADEGYEVDEAYFAERYPRWERFDSPTGPIDVYRVSGNAK